MVPTCRLLLFVVLSIADLLLTWHLLQRQGGSIYESNPIANWWLSRYGWAGMAGFKAGAVLLTSALVVVISRHRPGLGRMVGTFACCTLTGVVLYSCSLAWLAPAGAMARGAEEAAMAAEARFLDQKIARERVYSQLLEQLARDVSEGRCTLAKAAQILATTAKARDPAWLTMLRNYNQGRTHQECLALSVIDNAVARLQHDPPMARRVARQLAEDFRLTYGVSVPRAPMVRWRQQGNRPLRSPSHRPAEGRTDRTVLSIRPSA